MGATDGRVAVRWFDEAKDSGTSGGKKNAYTFKAAVSTADAGSTDRFAFPLRCIETHPVSAAEWWERRHVWYRDLHAR